VVFSAHDVILGRFETQTLTVNKHCAQHARIIVFFNFVKRKWRSMGRTRIDRFRVRRIVRINITKCTARFSGKITNKPFRTLRRSFCGILLLVKCVVTCGLCEKMDNPASAWCVSITIHTSGHFNGRSCPERFVRLSIITMTLQRRR